MSGKLDQSLDQIMEDRKSTNPRAQRRRKAPARGKVASNAPTGGIQKSTKANKPAKVVVAGVPASGDSKIIVSNLPEDVSETLIKDFFAKAVGHVKKVLLSYGPNGRSRGEATVTFNKPLSATDAHSQYNGVKVDGRPMKIEVVGGIASAAIKQKTLQDRMAQPKSAANAKAGGKNAPKAGAKAPGGKAAAGNAKANNKPKSGRAGRPKKKTAEELDAEMQDYFGGAESAAPANGQATTNGGAATVAETNGGDAGMVDEVL